MPIDQVLPVSPQASGGVSDGVAGYYPEPSTTGTSMFQDLMTVAGSVAGEIGGGSLELGSFAGLIEAQIQAQMELQTVSLVSNLERSKHETKMAAIRNIRVS